MNYYNEIYSKERHKVITYFEIGNLLNEAGRKYGDDIIGEYSNRLVRNRFYNVHNKL